MNTPTPRTDAAWAQTFDANAFLSGRGNAANQMRDACATLERELAALTAERDQLRVDRYYNRKCINRLASATGTLGEKSEKVVEVALSTIDQLRARAERAEASLHAMRLVCGTTDADKFTTWVDRANARAEKAEAELAAAKERLRSEAMDDYGSIKDLQRELATERARLDDLVSDLNDACITLASAKDDCDDYALLNTGFKLTAVRDVLIQYIPNAAMKEGAK